MAKVTKPEVCQSRLFLPASWWLVCCFLMQLRYCNVSLFSLSRFPLCNILQELLMKAMPFTEFHHCFKLTVIVWVFSSCLLPFCWFTFSHVLSKSLRALVTKTFEEFTATYGWSRNEIYFKALFCSCFDMVLNLKPARLWGIGSPNVVCVVEFCQSAFLLSKSLYPRPTKTHAMEKRDRAQ